MRFVYQALADSTAAAADHITDFTGGDLIDLSALDANAGAGGDQAFGFIGSLAFSNTAGELRAEFDSGAGAWRIEGDVDGNGAADFLILATAAAPLTGSDFVF